MGDFSSTFRIHNRTSMSMKLTIGGAVANNGYWYTGRQPPQQISANSKSDWIQLKDRGGFTGTKGTVVYSVNQTTGNPPFVRIFVQCPTVGSNQAEITVTGNGGDKFLAYATTPNDGHPMIVQFLVVNRESRVTMSDLELEGAFEITDELRELLQDRADESVDDIPKASSTSAGR